MLQTTGGAIDAQATIGRRMVYVMQGVQRIVKDKQMAEGQKYKYVSHDQVVEAVRGLMCEAGIIMQQKIVETAMQLQEVLSYDKKVTQIYYTMKMEFDFCNADDLQDKVTVESVGMGIDRSDKATGKAMSYCKKYAILQAFLIPTGDDPDHDQESAQGRPLPTRAERQQAAASRPSPTQPNATPAAEASVDWNRVCRTRYQACADLGIKDDAAKLWSENAADPRVLARKLKELYDQANLILNGAAANPNDPPF